MTNIWNMIIHHFKDNPHDVKTAPINKREPKWFYVYTDGCNVFVKKAESHEEKCNIKGKRKLDSMNVDIVYDYYLKRKAGINSKQNANEYDYNRSYWYGIFTELGL